MENGHHQQRHHGRQNEKSIKRLTGESSRFMSDVNLKLCQLNVSVSIKKKKEVVCFGSGMTAANASLTASSPVVLQRRASTVDAV